MIINDVTYSRDIEKMIIANLDGWVIEKPVTNTNDDSTDDNATGGINPFMTSTELKEKANKVITSTECKIFYEEALDKALMYTNRLNIDDLNPLETRSFIRAVCKWAASNLWNKYNIRVNNEDMEDTYVQSYGGLLYKSALDGLKPFINQTISSMSNILNNKDDTTDYWGRRR